MPRRSATSTSSPTPARPAGPAGPLLLLDLHQLVVREREDVLLAALALVDAHLLAELLEHALRWPQHLFHLGDAGARVDRVGLGLALGHLVVRPDADGAQQDDDD